MTYDASEQPDDPPAARACEPKRETPGHLSPAQEMALSLYRLGAEPLNKQAATMMDALEGLV